MSLALSFLEDRRDTGQVGKRPCHLQFLWQSNWTFTAFPVSRESPRSISVLSEVAFKIRQNELNEQTQTRSEGQGKNATRAGHSACTECQDSNCSGDTQSKSFPETLRGEKPSSASVWEAGGRMGSLTTQKECTDKMSLGEEHWGHVLLCPENRSQWSQRGDLEPLVLISSTDTHSTTFYNLASIQAFLAMVG